MSLRTSLVLLVLLVLAAGSLMLSQFRPRTSSDAQQPAPWFYSVTSDDIQQITVQYRGEQLTFLYQNGDWVFDDKYHTPVSSERWGGILTLLSGPQSRRLLVQEAGDPSVYGLGDPPGWVDVDLKGERRFRINLGNKTENRSSHYVQLQGSPQVYLVDAAWGDVLTRLVREEPYPNWYYRASAGQASELDIVYQGTKVSFVNDDERGWVVETGAERSERPTVDTNRWREAVEPYLDGPDTQRQVVPELQDGDETDYGLDDPTAIIRMEFFTIEQNGLRVFHDREWTVGKKSEEGDVYYTKLFGFPPVVAVNVEWVEGMINVTQNPPGGETAQASSALGSAG